MVVVALMWWWIVGLRWVWRQQLIVASAAQWVHFIYFILFLSFSHHPSCYVIPLSGPRPPPSLSAVASPLSAVIVVPCPVTTDEPVWGAVSSFCFVLLFLLFGSFSHFFVPLTRVGSGLMLGAGSAGIGGLQRRVYFSACIDGSGNIILHQQRHPSPLHCQPRLIKRKVIPSWCWLPLYYRPRSTKYYSPSQPCCHYLSISIISLSLSVALSIKHQRQRSVTSLLATIVPLSLIISLSTTLLYSTLLSLSLIISLSMAPSSTAPPITASFQLNWKVDDHVMMMMPGYAMSLLQAKGRHVFQKRREHRRYASWRMESDWIVAVKWIT